MFSRMKQLSRFYTNGSPEGNSDASSSSSIVPFSRNSNEKYNKGLQVLQLTPVWEHIIRTRQLPVDLNVAEVFDELNERLHDPEWQVRQHALRVLVDLLIVIGDDADMYFSPLIAPLVENLGHDAPSIRKAALDSLRIYIANTNLPETIMLEILEAGLEGETGACAGPRYIIGVILSIPSLIQPVLLTSKRSFVLRTVFNVLENRMLQIQYQEIVLKVLIKIKEMIGEKEFNATLPMLMKRDFELLCKVYQVHNSSGNNGNLKKNESAQKSLNYMLEERHQVPSYSIVPSEPRQVVQSSKEFSKYSLCMNNTFDMRDSNIDNLNKPSSFEVIEEPNQNYIQVNPNKYLKKDIMNIKDKCTPIQNVYSCNNEEKIDESDTLHIYNVNTENFKPTKQISKIKNLQNEIDEYLTTNNNTMENSSEPLWRNGKPKSANIVSHETPSTNFNNGENIFMSKQHEKRCFSATSSKARIVEERKLRPSSHTSHVFELTNKDEGKVIMETEIKLSKDTAVTMRIFETPVEESDSKIDSKICENLEFEIDLEGLDDEEKKNLSVNIVTPQFSGEDSNTKKGKDENDEIINQSFESNKHAPEKIETNHNQNNKSFIVKDLTKELKTYLVQSPEKNCSTNESLKFQDKNDSFVIQDAEDISESENYLKTRRVTFGGEIIKMRTPDTAAENSDSDMQISSKVMFNEPRNKSPDISSDSSTQNNNENKPFTSTYKRPNTAHADMRFVASPAIFTFPPTSSSDADHSSPTRKTFINRSKSATTFRTSRRNSLTVLEQRLSPQPAKEVTILHDLQRTPSPSPTRMLTRNHYGSCDSIINRHRNLAIQTSFENPSGLLTEATQTSFDKATSDENSNDSSEGSIEKSWESIGVVSSTVLKNLKSQEHRLRAHGFSKLEEALKSSDALSHIQPHLPSLLKALLHVEEHPEIIQQKHRIVTNLILRLPLENLEKNFGFILTGIIKQSGSSSNLVAKSMMTRLPTAAIVTKILSDEFLYNRSSKFKENALKMILFALTIFPSTYFDLGTCVKQAANLAMDRKKRVRQAALDVLAILGQISSNKLVIDIIMEVVKYKVDGDTFISAVRQRLSRKILPVVESDGEVTYALQLPISKWQQSANNYGADIDWICADSGSSSPTGVKKRKSEWSKNKKQTYINVSSNQNKFKKSTASFSTLDIIPHSEEHFCSRNQSRSFPELNNWKNKSDTSFLQIPLKPSTPVRLPQMPQTDVEFSNYYTGTIPKKLIQLHDSENSIFPDIQTSTSKQLKGILVKSLLNFLQKKASDTKIKMYNQTDVMTIEYLYKKRSIVADIDNRKQDVSMWHGKKLLNSDNATKIKKENQKLNNDGNDVLTSCLSDIFKYCCICTVRKRKNVANISAIPSSVQYSVEHTTMHTFTIPIFKFGRKSQNLASHGQVETQDDTKKQSPKHLSNYINRSYNSPNHSYQRTNNKKLNEDSDDSTATHIIEKSEIFNDHGRPRSSINYKKDSVKTTKPEFENDQQKELKFAVEIEPIEQVTIKTPPLTPITYIKSHTPSPFKSTTPPPISPINVKCLKDETINENLVTELSMQQIKGSPSKLSNQFSNKQPIHSDDSEFTPIPFIPNIHDSNTSIQDSYESTTDNEQYRKPFIKTHKKLKHSTPASAENLKKKKFDDSFSNKYTEKSEKPRDLIVKCFVQLQSSNWEEIIQGIENFVLLFKKHPDIVDANLHLMTIELGKQIKNLRSQVARAACQAAADLFQTHRKTIEPEAEELTSNLLHRTSDTNKFLRNDAIRAIEIMTENLPPSKVIHILCFKGATHHNGLVRCATAKLLNKFVNKLGGERIYTMNRETRDKLILTCANLLMEGSLETRNYTKDIFRSISCHPNYSKILVDVIPPRIYRNIEKALKSLR
uniref:CSON000902 protein n=1 Tax=Culicoides sonorensis TaxID=179676 RepID=A0A336LQB6_CULSO